MMVSRKILPALLVAATAMNGPAFAGPDPSAAVHWVGSWGAAPSEELGTVASTNATPFADRTLRSVITLSAGGEALRLRLSNELAAAPLKIDKVTVGRWRGGAVVSGSLQVVRFRQQDSVMVPGGAAATSDAVALPTGPGEQLVVSIHVPGPPVERLTSHLVGLDPSWSIEGDFTGAEQIPAALPGFSRYLLSRVDVATKRPDSAGIVALGDSITDGYQSSFGASRRWPDVLARLAGSGGKCVVGVVNQGISSNRVLSSSNGLSAVARLERDVFSVPGAKTLIVLEGVNDLIFPVFTGEAMPSPGDFQAAYQQMADEAHARGIRIIVGTILPFKGVAPPSFSPEGEKVRREVNSWLRSSTLFDKVVDLDRALADPADRERLAREFDSGDGIHPSDKGYEAIGKAFFGALADGKAKGGCPD